jgi:hypothetical protein
MAIDVQRLRAECVYETDAPLRSILDDLEQIKSLLQSTAGRRGKLIRFGVILLIASIIGIIIGAIIAKPFVIGLCVMLVIASIVLLIYGGTYGRRLLKHGTRLVRLKKRLGIIQQDAPAQEDFSVRLSLVSTPQVLSGEPWPVRKHGKQQFSKESWLSIEGPLLDGTMLSEEITELSRKRTFTNQNGKRKTKIRSRYLVTLRFVYPSDLYGDASRAHSALHEEVRVPPSATIRAVRVNEKAITLKALVRNENEIVQTAGMLSMGAYRVLNLARRVLAGQRGTAK